MGAQSEKLFTPSHPTGYLYVLSELFAQRNDSRLRSNSMVDPGVNPLNCLFRPSVITRFRQNNSFNTTRLQKRIVRLAQTQKHLTRFANNLVDPNPRPNNSSYPKYCHPTCLPRTSVGGSESLSRSESRIQVG